MAKADFAKAKEMFPSTSFGDEEWRAFFQTPDGLHAMGRILYDIYDKVVDEQEREAGLRRMGRRPARDEVPLAEVYRKVLPPPPSQEPFPVALKYLLHRRSLRSFAPKIPIDVSTLSRMMRSGETPDIAMLERIAAAAKVHPAYFLEWRAQFVAQLIQSVYLDQPHLSITAFRALRGGKQALIEGRLAA